MTKGSSPRGRGKRVGITPPGEQTRLIPARAGKTRSAAGSPARCQAHPRAGGENRLSLRTASPTPGSSPRGRGKQRPPANNLTAGGLIPARAGKTHRRAERRARTGGSSPRGRGKRPGQHAARAPDGLIPARAGKTLSPQSQLNPTWAHPRAGGENSEKLPSRNAP